MIRLLGSRWIFPFLVCSRRHLCFSGLFSRCGSLSVMSHTRRGFGSCPQCHHQYSTHWKPKECVNCGFELGGNQHAAAKKVKSCCPDAVLVYQSATEKIFSAKTSSRDDRCFVQQEGETWFCSHNDCKNTRASFVSSGRINAFSCKHSAKCTDAVSVQETYSISLGDIEKYKGDSAAKDSLKSLLTSHGDFPLVVKVSDVSFAVFGFPSTNNTLGYTHVRISAEDILKCSSKDTECKSFVAKGKYQRAKKLCLHLHALFCSGAYVFHDGEEEVDEGEEDEASIEPTQPTQRKSTLQLAARTFMYHTSISPQILKEIDSRNAEGWPSEFLPSDSLCELCGHLLGNAVKQPGSDGEAFLVIASGVPFSQVEVRVKICPRSLHLIYCFHFISRMKYSRLICIHGRLQWLAYRLSIVNAHTDLPLI